MRTSPVPSSLEQVALSVLRAVCALLLVQHGAQKLLGLLGGFGGVPGRTAPLFSLLGLAGVLELFFGLALLVGLFTRPVAFILSGEMAVAYFRNHFPKGFWPILNHGELTVLYCFVFLFLAVAGGGAWSVDRLLFRKAERGQSASPPHPV